MADVVNVALVVGFDAGILYFMGFKALMYLLVGVVLGGGLHPMAGHLIAEHYMFLKVRPCPSWHAWSSCISTARCHLAGALIHAHICYHVHSRSALRISQEIAACTRQDEGLPHACAPEIEIAASCDGLAVSAGSGDIQLLWAPECPHLQCWLPQ